LDIRRVDVSYPGPDGDVPVIDAASLHVCSGECVALCGPSGSGKSTLLSVAAGLVRPAAGTVVLCEKDLAACDDAERAAMRVHRLGMVFQAFHLLGHLNAAENVMVPAWLAGESRRDARSAALHALDRVDLSARALHRPSALSGGEQQRVAIARAVVNRPDLILADEPTGNLDAAATALVADMLAGMARGGAAVLIATHDPLVASSADRTIDIGPAEGSRQGVSTNRTYTSTNRTI
jgi:ABC-type lipoprotein export system ATPase subunit